jgi:hypothetical protein
MVRRDLRLRDYARVAEAATVLSMAALMVALLPFRRVIRTAAWRGAAKPRGDTAIASDQATTAIDRAARRLPLRLVCIQRSLALQWMLRRRGHSAQLHYGVHSKEDRISAHVWVSLAGRILVGEADAGNYACVATIPAHPG